MRLVLDLTGRKLSIVVRTVTWDKEAELFGADPKRVAVWYALSEFYLDTELQANDIERIAQTLARSPYSLDELRHIELVEVRPVCMWNLLLVAGEWTRFAPERLIPTCMANQRKNPFDPAKRPALLERFLRAYCPISVPEDRIAEIRLHLAT